MAGFGLFNFNVDAKSVEPIAVAALAAAAVYFLWQHIQTVQANNAQAGAETTAGDLTGADTSDLEQLSLLQSLTGASTGAASNSSTGQVTYSAPASSAGTGTTGTGTGTTTTGGVTVGTPNNDPGNDPANLPSNLLQPITQSSAFVSSSGGGSV